MKLKQIKNKLVKIHRLLGLALAIIMLVWFISGIVMIYSGFPKFSGMERTKAVQKISAEDFNGYESYLKTITANAKEIKLYKFAGHPVCEVIDEFENKKRYFLDSKTEIKNVDEAFALKIAANSFHIKDPKYELEMLNKLDTWIPWERMTKHFPIYKFYFEDEKETQVYVSSVTGEILQQSNSSDRFWSYFGAIPHWFYFKDLRRHIETWRWVTIVVSGVGSLMCLAGIIAGFIRINKKRKNKILISPYTSGLYKWHHYLGFLFGFITLTWTFSGMMSLVPADWFYSDKEEEIIIEKWEKSFGIIESFDYGEIFYVLEKSPIDIKYITIKNFAGKNYTVFKKTNFNSFLFFKRELKSRNDVQLIESNIDYIKKEFAGEIKKTEILTEYDNYYYAKKMKRALPVIKVEFDNKVNTNFYIDPLTKKLIKANNKFSRIRRWLYNGLHSLDFSFLYHSGFWHPTVWILMIGGSGLSLTGVLFIFRRMKSKAKK